MSSTLDRLRSLVDAEGLEEGTPAYERKLLTLRVEKCVEMQGVSTCSECKAFDHCEYAAAFLRLRQPGR